MTHSRAAKLQYEANENEPEAPSNGVSFVIPCLNEEQTLPLVLEKITRLCRSQFSERPTEIIVSDNGSSDRSVEIAERSGARVIHCPTRGYGAALLHGIRNAQNAIVVFADADNTYDFLETPLLVDRLEEGFDLVLGSRLRGTILPGAMPLLHRHVGTPILSGLINLLYADRTNAISDCNSGFRCFRKSAFEKWGIGSTGMEFASEMLVRAMRHQASIAEVPISLAPDTRGRVPHLKTWRDGMRHLLQILKESPAFFLNTGVITFLLSWIVLITATAVGPLQLGPFRVFGIHSMMVALVGSLFALALWSAGLMIVTRSGSSSKAYTPLITLGEERLFWGLVSAAVLCVTFFLRVLFVWEQNEFSFLAMQQELLLITAAASNIIFISTQIFTAHLIKRT